MADTNIYDLGRGQVYRYLRNSFAGAGQQSYDNPPGENQELFQQLINTMPVSRGNLERRDGTRFLAQPFTSAIRRTYEFQTTVARRLLIILDSIIAVTDESGTVIGSTALTGVNRTAPARALVSRGYAYCSTGDASDRKKLAADGTAYNWGVDPSDTATKVVDAVPGTVVNGGWTNPNNVQVQDDVFSTITLTCPIITPYTFTVWIPYPPPGHEQIENGVNVQDDVYSAPLDLKNFAPGIPTQARITDITVKVRGFSTDTRVEGAITLLKPSAASGTRTPFKLSTTLDEYAISVPVDGFSPADVNAAGFGVRLEGHIYRQNLTGTISIDSVTITISYVTVPLLVGTPVAGSVTLLGGRTYFVIPYSTITGVFGDVGSASASTGALTSKDIPLTAIVVPTDPQLDRKKIAATADGGDESVLYELADLPASATTFTDNVPEATLLEGNILQETDDEGIDHGCALNFPPPDATLFCKHLGRLYALKGSTLYFSKNLDELTTSTGLICGRYEEAWPGDYQLDISEGSETGSDLFSDGTLLYIVTERHIRRLAGNGPLNFSAPEIQFNEVGVLSPEVRKIVFVEGQPIGAMWLTPDFKIMGSDFNTYDNIGRPIQDLLNTINRAAKDKCHAAFFGSGAYSMYLLAIPTGLNTECDTVCVFDLVNKRWHIWRFPFPVTSMLFTIPAGS